MLVDLIYKYKNKEYKVEIDIKNTTDEESIYYVFEDGNYSDDGTRADLINKTYGENTVPKFDNGNTEIELINTIFQR